MKMLSIIYAVVALIITVILTLVTDIHTGLGAVVIFILSVAIKKLTVCLILQKIL